MLFVTAAGIWRRADPVHTAYRIQLYCQGSPWSVFEYGVDGRVLCNGGCIVGLSA